MIAKDLQKKKIEFLFPSLSSLRNFPNSDAATVQNSIEGIPMQSITFRRMGN